MAFFTYKKEMIRLISRSLSLVSKELDKYYEMVAYLAYHIGEETGLKYGDLEDVTMSALFHDLGAIGHEKMPTPQELEADLQGRSSFTAGILSVIPGMKGLSEIIRVAPFSYEYLSVCDLDPLVLKKAQIVHAAVKFASNINDSEPVLTQVDRIIHGAKCAVGEEFSLEIVDALLNLRKHEDIWLRFVYEPETIFYELAGNEKLDLNATLDMSHLVGMIVDFRSPFTVMHSAGVEASAVKLAEIMGLDDETIKKMSIAGALHDIGKLRVPGSILEKPGKLTDDEFNLIKEHPFFTYQLLSEVTGFEDIACWAGYHHEKLEGRGYPFNLTHVELTTECRIMAVADVFSALAEDRPYRKGMDKNKILDILDEMADHHDIDYDIVELLVRNYDEVDAYRNELAKKVGSRYYREK